MLLYLLQHSSALLRQFVPDVCTARPFFSRSAGVQHAMAWPLGARLPPELVALVRRHAAAARIQGAWRRWDLLAHARRAPWAEVKAGLGDAHWRALLPYAGVRREWRHECASWLACADLGVIRAEARAGLWGPAAPRLAPPHARSPHAGAKRSPRASAAQTTPKSSTNGCVAW